MEITKYKCEPHSISEPLIYTKHTGLPITEESTSSVSAEKNVQTFPCLSKFPFMSIIHDFFNEITFVSPQGNTLINI